MSCNHRLLQFLWLRSLHILLLSTIGSKSVMGFSSSVPSRSISSIKVHHSTFPVSILPSFPSSRQQNRICSRVGDYDNNNDNNSDDDDDDSEGEDNDYEFARVGRKRGRRNYDDNNVDAYEDSNDNYNNNNRSRRDNSSVMDAADLLEGEGIFDDMDDDDDDYDCDDEDDDESYDIFSNTVIPNPILDSIDPDGAAERFPELASDPKFWFDIILFIVFLDFVSFAGPRQQLADIIPQMYNAQLPPPGLL